MRIGIIGAGAVGRALGKLLSNGGHDVLYGVRNPAGSCQAFVPDVIAASEIIVIAIPYDQIESALGPFGELLAGKVLVDASNPLRSDWSPLLLGEETSAGETVQRLFPAARVVKAFNTIFADVMAPDRLARREGRITAFIASDDRDAATLVERLAQDASFEPLHAGPMSSARWLEAMAHLNIRLAVQLGGGTGGAFLYSRAA